MVSGKKISLDKKERVKDLFKYTVLSKQDIHKKENIGIRQLTAILKGIKISKQISLKKRKRWNKRISTTLKGRKMPYVSESNRRRKGEKHPTQSEYLKKRWKDPEKLKNWFKAVNTKPNKAEIRLLSILQQIESNWHYVGDGSLIIEGKCPDFYDGAGHLVELFGDHWHKSEEEKERINFFKKHGWECVILWEHDLKDENTINEKLGQIARGFGESQDDSEQTAIDNWIST